MSGGGLTDAWSGRHSLPPADRYADDARLSGDEGGEWRPALLLLTRMMTSRPVLTERVTTCC